MVELCRLLKKKRYERGSIEFALPETIILVDSDGSPLGTETVEYDVTHQLVEEFMLKANELVATHLSEQGKNITYRIHDEPSGENLKDFSILAGAFGYELSETPQSSELQRLFDEALATSYGPFLATSYIRRMRLAQYSVDNIGHYGLGLSHYCHFTSPIRRYVDLAVHRILFGEADTRETVDRISHECSEQERISARAEASVVHLKKLRLLEKKAQESSYKQFEAIVTQVKPFGFYFEVLDLMLEGFIHVSELGNDYYAFSEETLALKGVRHGFCYHCGERITLKLKNIDFILRECQWEIVLDKQVMANQERTHGHAKRERRRSHRKGHRKGKKR
jgi:ribonuclease R